MLVEMVDVMAAGSRAVDREITRVITGDRAARRRVAGTALALLVWSHLRPEITRYRSKPVDVDRGMVDA